MELRLNTALLITSTEYLLVSTRGKLFYSSSQKINFSAQHFQGHSFAVLNKLLSSAVLRNLNRNLSGFFSLSFISVSQFLHKLPTTITIYLKLTPPPHHMTTPHTLFHTSSEACSEHFFQVSYKSTQPIMSCSCFGKLSPSLLVPGSHFVFMSQPGLRSF